MVASGHEEDVGDGLLSVKVRIGTQAKRTRQWTPRTRLILSFFDGWLALGAGSSTDLTVLLNDESW